MKKLYMWNVITLDGYFEGEKAWDLDFHSLVWGKELEDFDDHPLEARAPQPGGVILRYAS